MFTDGVIDGVIVRDLTKFPDHRGWLMELFREDEVAPEFMPVMGYLSYTNPGIARGPHEHREQADYFCFPGPSMFRLYLWDNRTASRTYRVRQTLTVGLKTPAAVIVPAGVVHAYRNIGNELGMVVNCANRLYAGRGKKEEVDEIRHENDTSTEFRLD